MRTPSQSEYNTILPPPVVKDRVEEYKVEWILDSRLFRGKLEYLVSEFHCWNPEAPQHICTLDFSNLPFRPLSNFTNTPDTVPSGWAMGHRVSGHHAFEGGGKCQGLSNPTPDFRPTLIYHTSLGNH